MPASVALVAENDAATLVCGDRAVTNATIASGFATLNLTFPAEVSGYVRDFYLRTRPRLTWMTRLPRSCWLGASRRATDAYRHEKRHARRWG